MTGNEKGAGPVANSSSSSSCRLNVSGWESSIEMTYSYFYLLVFIPGLLLNATALWVLCRHISKNNKAVIFMINLALADLIHILSLPFRIYYYFTHLWPFGHGFCLFCFYLKYLNMYAAIAFLVCISVQRCAFLLHPFAARRWRRRYDLLISAVVWLVVSLGCSPFILMRGGGGGDTPTPTQQPLVSLHIVSGATGASWTSGAAGASWTSGAAGAAAAAAASGASGAAGCFKDLPMRRLSVSLAVAMMALAELFGFVIPVACIGYSSMLTARSLKHQDGALSHRPRSLRLRSDSQRGGGEQADAEKRRALRMVLGCSALFLVCFAPYHLNFLLYLMVSQGIVSHCPTELAVRGFHPLSLCLASLSCCLNPLLYYFLTAEFRLHLGRHRASSLSSSVFSSPLNSPTQRQAPARLLSTDSSCSERP